MKNDSFVERDDKIKEVEKKEWESRVFGGRSAVWGLYSPMWFAWHSEEFLSNIWIL